MGGFQLPIEDLIFSGGGGFLFGILAGYAIKKVMKIAAIIIGLFVVALAYLSYKGLLDVKWASLENVTRYTLSNAYEQTFHILNSTSAQFAAHPSIIAISGLPVATGVGFVPGLMMGLKRGRSPLKGRSPS